MVDETEPPDEGGAGPNDPITKTLLEALAAKSLVLDCPEMTLTQNTTATPEIIRGRGSISLRDRFTLKLYADPGTDGLNEFKQLADWVSGTIIPDAEFYSLRVVDINGVVWQWARVHIKRSGLERVVIEAELEGLQQISTCTSASSSVALFFYDQPGVVCNQYVERTTRVAGESFRSMELAAATFETPEFIIRVRPTPIGGGAFSIRIHSKRDAFPGGIVYRVIEALSYATFHPLSWCVSKMESAGRREVTLAPPVAARGSLMSSPVPAHPGYGATSFWALFTAFLHRVMHDADSEHYSPLFAQLRPVIYSETRELIVLALLLPVCVEGILNLEFADLAQPTDAFKHAIEDAKTILKSLDSIDPRIHLRLLGALGPMKSARAGDRLKLLMERGAITKSMFAAWQSLRNASTHASINPQSHDTQKLWSQCNTVATLLNLLVFMAVDYSGNYVDYSTPGWPHKSFPPPTSPSTGEVS